MPDVAGALSIVLAMVGDVLTRDASVAERLAADPPLWSALGVALLAWLSTGLAHSGVLFINRVRGVRMVVAGGVGLFWVLTLRVIEALVTWAAAWLVTGKVVPATTVITIFLLASAPQVFNVLTFVPHLGLFLGRALEAWSFLVLFLLLSAAYAVPGWLGLLVAASGWVLIQVASRLLAAPLGWLGSFLWTMASGQPVLLTSRDILAGTPFVPVRAEQPARES